MNKKRTALEEAEWEDEGEEDGFDKEIMFQGACFETWYLGILLTSV